MKNSSHISDITQDAFSLKPRVILGVLLSFCVFAVAQLVWQYSEAKKTFSEQTQALENIFLIEEQRTETLLKALANYYSSQSVKSIDEFSRFAESIVPQHPFIEAFGIAQKVQAAEAQTFINEQHKMGFESFQVENKKLFHESATNFTNESLTITRVLPLTPAHSIYLGEDLFTLPTLHHEYRQLSEKNQMGLYWLRSSLNNKQFILLNHPIYSSSANSLSPKDRQDNSIGGVFLLFDIIPFITQTANQQIQHLLQIELQTLNHPLKQNWTMYSAAIQNTAENTLENWVNALLQNVKFQTQIQISALRTEMTLGLTAMWRYQAIDGRFVFFWGLLGAMLFLLLTLVAKVFSGYTKTLLKMQSRLEEILHTSHDAVIITNNKGGILSWNPRAVELFGYKAEEVIGTSLIELFIHLSENNLKDPVERKLVKLFASTASHKGTQNTHQKLLELYLLNRSRERILVEISYSILSVNDTEEISLFIQDITYQRKAESEIKKLAYYDPLTNLENRVLFKQNFESILQRPTPPNFSVYFIDLDGFKQVNDSLGHNIGDELLKVIARRIVNTIQGAHQPHHICRFGGDEFIILIETADKELSKTLLERLLQKIQRLIRIDGNELQVSASIGVTFYPQHGEDMDTLLRHADTAMYEAKKQGKNTYSVYQNEMTEHLSRRLLLEKHLRLALEYNEFKLVYQPQIDLKTGRVIGVEALIRWHNTSLGFISPDKFIPIAEESRMIINIGDWVVDTCIEQLKEWQSTSMQGLHIAINVSSVQFTHPGFVDGVYQKMKLAGLPSHLLEIELTERTVMDNADENIERFNDIRNQGFGLSVDDFGTGYSSLSYLKRFPLSILKIDKSFIDGLPNDDYDKSIANAILNLAHSLNIKVVAEGVETIEQLLFLKEANCNFAQGYFISKPLPAGELETWLAAQTRCFYDSSEFKTAM